MQENPIERFFLPLFNAILKYIIYMHAKDNDNYGYYFA